MTTWEVLGLLFLMVILVLEQLAVWLVHLVVERHDVPDLIEQVIILVHLVVERHDVPDLIELVIVLVRNPCSTSHGLDC